jgi:hypothetical protein
VFLALVAPWQWVAVRAVVGGALVVGGSTLVARLTTPTTDDAAVGAVEQVSDPGPDGPPLRRFLLTLARTALVVVPE